MKKVLLINGSYRQGGVSDQVLDTMVGALQHNHADYQVVHLRNQGLQFCTNCRVCAQEEGSQPGECILDDSFNALVASLEEADSFVFICPTNFGTVTALFKQFMERLIVYGYYPWGARGPQHRKRKCTKKALIVTSYATPAFVSYFFSTVSLVKKCATLLGADIAGTMRIGKTSLKPDYTLSKHQLVKAEQLVSRLC